MKNIVLSLVRRVPEAAYLFFHAMRGEVTEYVVEEVADEGQPTDFVQMDTMEAAYLTTGLLTAGVALSDAHADGENCRPHHLALASMLHQIPDAPTAVMVINNLITVACTFLDTEEVSQLVASLVREELSDDDDYF